MTIKLSMKVGLEQRLYNELVEENREMLRIRRPFRPLIQPYDPTAEYPLSRIGNFARVTSRYMENWVNMPQLLGKINGGDILDGLEREAQYSALHKTLHQIGNDSYLTDEEWNDPNSFKQIDSTIEPATGITLDANYLLAKSLCEKLKQELGAGRYVVCDIGPGSGNTIAPLIEMMEEIGFDYRRRLQVILVDGQQEALLRTQQRLAKKAGIEDQFSYPLDRVELVHDNFSALESNPTLHHYQGKVDLIISGGAIMHNTHKESFFRGMYDLLKDDGIFGCWDWYFKTFLAPSLRRGEEVARVFRCIDPSSEEITEFKLAEDELTPEQLKNQQRYCQCSIVGELPQNELKLAYQNCLNWLSLFGYIRHEKDTVIEKKMYNKENNRFESVSGRLTRLFWEKVSEEDGFNFIEDFLTDLVGIEPFHRTAYNYIESYGDDYAPQLIRAGFIFAEDLSLQKVAVRLAQELHLDLVKQNMIKFTFAGKLQSLEQLLGK